MNQNRDEAAAMTYRSQRIFFRELFALGIFVLFCCWTVESLLVRTLPNVEWCWPLTGAVFWGGLVLYVFWEYQWPPIIFPVASAIAMGYMICKGQMGNCFQSLATHFPYCTFGDRYTHNSALCFVPWHATLLGYVTGTLCLCAAIGFILMFRRPTPRYFRIVVHAINMPVYGLALTYFILGENAKYRYGMIVGIEAFSIMLSQALSIAGAFVLGLGFGAIAKKFFAWRRENALTHPQ